MFLSETQAEARLEELRRQRAALDRLIGEHELYLELGRRLAGVAAPPAAPEPAPAAPAVAGSPRQDGPRQEGRRLIEAALAVLSGAGRPMHAAEIWEQLAASGLTLPGHDPVAALNTRLWKRAQGNGPVRRLGDAVYAAAEAGRG
ncbi:HTH domain-containing protein [uncultured Methylobacterium sp.]|uniref:HTH domain-containing protein n=1 Tax=uncultured Methylobacterium sp. TaxID=157278 RepID=UPI002622B702|nr:HTH domain-containing protein [uncultured Methylobacterium sp.]